MSYLQFSDSESFGEIKLPMPFLFAFEAGLPCLANKLTGVNYGSFT